MNSTAISPSTLTMINLERWRPQLPQMRAAYLAGDPFPFTSIDQFLEPWAAEKALEVFPKIGDDGWIHYMHFNEKKHGLNKMDLLPPFIQQLIGELNSPEFVAFISELTGIPNLLPDPSLEGGGLHQSKRGGFLNIHADFTVHPHKRQWRRRVNLLVYLNKGWQESFKGHLELWSRDMKACKQKISPVFNRAAMFNTDDDSYHGLPDPIQCPEEMTRKSIALYYFTEEQEAPRKRATNYQGRPQDGVRKVGIFLDKQMIAGYNAVKGALGINDDFASKVLNWLSGKKK